MNTQLNPTHFQVLLVEDNPDDVERTLKAFERGKALTHLSVVGDGVEALAFLRREGAYAHAPVPDLILLDLNLPRKSGQEVLAEIKQDPDLRRIPVVILTTSSSEVDILRSYNLRANAFIAKPVDINSFVAVVETIEDFWLTVVRLPTRQGL
jgi:CheY-like chemotaxis protein